MREVYGDLWTYPADVRVITTNGMVNKNGHAVMGRGCALEAADRWPQLPKLLGYNLKPSNGGNHVWWWNLDDQCIVTFPVKHDWRDKADLKIIERSAEELEGEADIYTDGPIVMPRPGCGYGGLDWEEVKPILEVYFDDRFHIITWK